MLPATWRITARPRLFIGVAMAIVLVLGIATGALGSALVRSGRTVTAVKVAPNAAEYVTGGNGYTDIPGMSLNITVPASTQAILLITFSADSYCSASSNCYVQALINGNYVIGNSYALVTFATPDRTTNSMQWVSGPMAAGTYTVKIQAAAAVGHTITLDARTLSVLRSKV